MSKNRSDEEIFSAVGSGSIGPEDIPQALINYLGDRIYDEALMVEYMCLYRFPVLQIFDEALYELDGPPPGGFPGTLLDQYRAECGLTIYVYEHCIMIGTGTMAYTDGNYTRMLRAMFEAFQTIVPERIEQQKWKNAAFVATHPKLENVAWVIAKLFNIPVNLMVETKVIEDLYARVTKDQPGTEWVGGIVKKAPTQQTP